MMLKRIAQNVRAYFTEPEVSNIAEQVRKLNLTYLSKQKIANIEWCISNVQRERVEGDFVEAGVALGGGAIIIASSMAQDRVFRGYDVFGMIPPPKSHKDDEKSKIRYEVIKSGQAEGIGGSPYYGYVEDLYGAVKATFAKFHLPVDSQRINLFKGLFADTMTFCVGDKVAFAHIDCDWYDPVRLCLERIYPVLSLRGIIVLDDYFNYGGCQTATNEFLEQHQNLKVVFDKGNLALMRVE
jgi:asparagine synthase (glutamine-hydrolysing)